MVGTIRKNKREIPVDFKFEKKSVLRSLHTMVEIRFFYTREKKNCVAVIVSPRKR